MDRLDDLAASVICKFRTLGLSLSLAESCTGGLISAVVTDIPGASEIFCGSAVTYADSAKENILGVSKLTIETFGAVSGECAAEMASGARRIYGADIAMSVTGVAGPGGGSAEKPVGTVWFGYSSEEKILTFRKIFSGDRANIRRQTAETVFDFLLEEIGSCG